VLRGVVKHLNTTLLNGQQRVFQRDLAAAQELLQRILQAFNRAWNWLSGLPYLFLLHCKLWATCVEGHGLPKTSQQPGEPEEIPPVGRSRNPPGDSACGNSRLATESQVLRLGIWRPF